MFRKNLKKEMRNVGVLRAMLILVMALSACSFDAEASVVSDDVPSVKEQELSDGEEVVTITEVPEIQKDTELLEESSGLVDGERNQTDTEPLEGNLGPVDDEQSEPEETENALVKEAKTREDSGEADDASEPIKNGQEQPEKGQEQPEEGQQEKGQEPEEGETEEQVQSWKSAYLEVIYHLWDYLAPRYNTFSHKDWRADDDPMNISLFYLGLHDFDGDGTLELITGDGLGLAVFTYEDGRVKKIADLCNPDLSEIWCVNGVAFKDNSISVECDGSGGIDWVNFGYFEGEYVLGHYNERTPGKPIIINGREGTVEEMDQIYILNYDKREREEYREHLRLVNENGVWILRHYDSDDESILDINFNFDSILW